MPFAQKLTQLRKERSLTQQEMAKKIGVGIAQIKRYEGGKSSPTLEVIKNIAKTLGVSADELIFDENERIPNTRIIDKKLLEQFESISVMDAHDQYAIKTILDGMIIKSRLAEVVPSATDSDWSKEMRKVASELRKRAQGYTDEEIETIVDDAVKAVRAEAKTRNKDIEA